MSAHHALMMSYPAMPDRVVDGADFDGTNDLLARGAGLTGAADSRTGILSAWVRVDGLGVDGGTRTLLFGAGGVGSGAQRGIAISLFGDKKLRLSAVSPAPAVILNVATVGDIEIGASWRHILAAWDLPNSVVRIYVDDVSDADTPTTLTNADIDYTNGENTVGAAGDGSQKWDGAIAEVYFAPGQFLDFTNVYHRRKFISAGGKPVHLGTDGSKPTGTAPLIYLHLDDAEAVASFATNRGTGGDFTITGTLATASTSPSD